MQSRNSLKAILRPALLGAAAALVLPQAGLADPPPWAPDYSQRATGANQYAFTASYQQFDQGAYAESTREYGVAQSTCNRDAVRQLVDAGAASGDASTAGVISGSLVGTPIGDSMDQVDQYCTGQALERADDYQAVSWTNPETGARYNVAATGIYQSGGQFCRGFVTRMILGDSVDTVEGQACRESDGTWRRVS